MLAGEHFFPKVLQVKKLQNLPAEIHNNNNLTL